MPQALSTALIVLGIIVGIPVALLFVWMVLVRIVRKFWHFPAPAFIGRILDTEHRRRLQPPDKLIERSGIKPGMKVLDLGCGSGAYTTFVARAVGPQGKVYALDIQAGMLAQLKRKLERPANQDIANIELVQASAYELPFADSSLDLVYMVTVLQEIPDRQKALAEVLRVLRSGGILAVTELLPDPDYPLKSATIKEVGRAGFRFMRVEGNLWNYTARFIKP